MGQLVYILGRSGTGKSYSLRNFPKDQVAVINVLGKVLPFKGSGAIEQTPTDDSTLILKALDIYAKDYKSIVIDDYQAVMSNEFMRRSYEKGYDKFTEIGRHAWDIVNKVRELPADVIVYILCHTDRDDEGNEKIKTIGKLLDEKICLEGLSTIVLKTAVSDGQYFFFTQNSGKDTVKSPSGMFPTYAIDNDLYYVDQKIRNYYELGEFKNDEEIAQMDAAVEKTDIEKPDADGKRRRKRAAAGDSADNSAKPDEAAEKPDDAVSPAPVAQTASEQPKTRRRKARNEQPDTTPAEVEKPVETPENAPQEEAPKRRRRRKQQTELNLSEPLDINDDELPF